jgi:hypothetical protein
MQSQHSKKTSLRAAAYRLRRGVGPRISTRWFTYLGDVYVYYFVLRRADLRGFGDA